jgi:hypothetical protein
MKPPTREALHKGLVEYAGIPDPATARTVVDRLAAISKDEAAAQILQRLNTAKPGRCPCCGFRADWHPRLSIPDGMNFMELAPGDD